MDTSLRQTHTAGPKVVLLRKSRYYMPVGLLEPNAEHCGEHLSVGWLLEGGWGLVGRVITGKTTLSLT